MSVVRLCALFTRLAFAFARELTHSRLAGGDWNWHCAAGEPAAERAKLPFGRQNDGNEQKMRKNTIRTERGEEERIAHIFHNYKFISCISNCVIVNFAFSLCFAAAAAVVGREWPLRERQPSAAGDRAKQKVNKDNETGNKNGALKRRPNSNEREYIFSR